jgi:hypothetical protein
MMADNGLATLTAALDHWYGAEGGESFRLVPMSDDGGVMPTGKMGPFAAAVLGSEYAFVRRDEIATLRAALTTIRNMSGGAIRAYADAALAAAKGTP